MALPETIPVRYTEEEAGYVSFRPVVRQIFRLHELLDMVLSVTGKEPARVQQILRSGTIVFHFYRYWWQGFEVSDDELATLLGAFPDPDPAREFRPESCTKVLIESGSATARPAIELDRASVAHRGLLRRRSFWDILLAQASTGPLVYHGYSYGHRADLYRLELSGEQRLKLASAAASLAPRNLRKELQFLSQASRLVFVCPRSRA
jgi:hypothetical protein